MSLERRAKKEIRQETRTRDLILVSLPIPILFFIASVISQRFIDDPDVDFGNAIGLALSVAIYGGAVYVYAIRPQR